MNKIQKCTIKNIICGLSTCLIWITLSGCIQSKAATTDSEVSLSAKQQKLISDNTLKIVNAAFYQTFVLGDWRYKGARNSGGTINAYIQIPRPLDMSLEVQKSYLKKAICPSSAHTSMWNEIDNIPLSVHIYTHKPKHSLYVNCTNPFSAG
ncbi:hypothetical protein [uncultured Paraglaciecola sp.]|jgi:hypothetical protein|uniref:hypothetical protein n=1 Tax=uncultured Paraglaciecola sp. TaxID=1765024 RepID=UPI0025DCD83B|nr:hypothetical protein [uncultured Paraglaciecola sp.]